MAKTSTYTVPIRVDTSALHRQLEHLGRTFQDVADAYFRAAQKVLEDASPEPELDTSDLADPEPSRVEIHNYPPNPGEWGDMLRVGTFADEPAHDPPTLNEVHGSYGDEPEVDEDPLLGERCDDCGLRYDDVYRVRDAQWRLLHKRAPAGLLCPPCLVDRALRFRDPLPSDPDVNERRYLAAVCEHGVMTGGAVFRTQDERARLVEMLRGHRTIVTQDYPVTVEWCVPCLGARDDEDLAEEGL